MFVFTISFVVSTAFTVGLFIAVTLVQTWEMDAHYRDVIIKTEKVLKTKHPHAQRKVYGLSRLLFAIDRYLQENRSPI